MPRLKELMQYAQLTTALNESNAQQDRIAQAERQQQVAAAMQLMGMLQEQDQGRVRQQATADDLALRTRALDMEDANRKSQLAQTGNRNLLDALDMVSGPNASPLAIEALSNQPGFENIRSARDSLTARARMGAIEKTRGMMAAVTDPAMRESLRPTLAEFPGAFDELVNQMYPPTNGATSAPAPMTIPDGYTEAGARGMQIGQQVQDFLNPVNQAIVDLYPNVANAAAAGIEGLGGAAGVPLNLGRMSSWWDMLQPPPIARPVITSRPAQQPQLTTR